jgi:uncharacterized membrane protein
VSSILAGGTNSTELTCPLAGFLLFCASGLVAKCQGTIFTMEMDTDILELKEEVEQLKAISVDTNKVVHKMRRGIWWGRIWTLAWWLILFGVSSAAYVYYLQPIALKAEQYYAQFQHQAGQSQGIEQQVGQFFGNLLKSMPQSPSVPSSGQ